MKPLEFIARLAPVAVQDMRKYGVPASLTLAQAILESNWGTSGLTQKANNLFGIKGTGPAGSVTMQTTEYQGRHLIQPTPSSASITAGANRLLIIRASS